MQEAFFTWGQKAPSTPAMLRVEKYAIERLISDPKYLGISTCTSKYQVEVNLKVKGLSVNNPHRNKIYMRHIQLLATKIYFGVIEINVKYTSNVCKVHFGEYIALL